MPHAAAILDAQSAPPHALRVTNSSLVPASSRIEDRLFNLQADPEEG